MKRLILFFVAFIGGIYVNGQDSVKKDTTWKIGGQFVLTFSQSSFTNWAAGGENALAGNTRINLFANYEKERLSWENNLDMAYGLSKQETVGELRKNDDLIELTSKLGYKSSKKWYYTALFGAKTQFDKGYAYAKADTLEDELKSAFLSPLDLNLAFGVDYKPNKQFSMFLSPLNSKLTYVKDDSLRVYNSLEPDQSFRYELGFIAKLKYQKDIIDDINLMTKLGLFADYLRLKSFDDIKNIDVNWEVLLTMKIFKVISVNFNTNIIWDSDIVQIPDSEKNKPNPEKKALIQYKQIFGAGLTYKF